MSRRPIHAGGLDDEVLAAFGIQNPPAPDLATWHLINERIRNPEGDVTIAIVGKYTGMKDAYKSLIKALSHGGIFNKVKVKLDWIESEVPRTKTPRRSSNMSTAFWCRAASASVALKERFSPPNSLASARCRISAFASACRWR